MFEPGERIRLHYPTSTAINRRLFHWRRRNLEVLALRDLVSQPLTPIEYLRRPLIRRGRLILIARDLTTGCRQQFYLANSWEFHDEPPMRIGLYLPECTRPIRLTDEEFTSTVADRIHLSKVLLRLRQPSIAGASICVFSDDMRRIG